MPNVRFYRTTLTSTGAHVPATGRIRFRPSKRLTIEGAPDNVVTPAPFTEPFVAGLVEVTIAATSPGWAWRVDESVDGVRDETYFVIVPDVPGPLDDTDLVRVHPGILTPNPAPADAVTFLLDTDGRPYFS